MSLRAAQREPANRFQHAGAMLAELEASAVRPRRLKRRILVLAAGVVMAVFVVAMFWRTVLRQQPIATEATATPEVEVNFLTEPYYNATIYMDGTLLEEVKGKPYVTPCTVPTVPSGEHHVVFKHPLHDDLDAGRIDFSRFREVNARWSDAPR